MAYELYHSNDVQLRQQITAHLQAIAALVTAGVSDTAYAASWNGVTTIAPSKNAVYDKIETITSNVTHTGEVTGATALTLDKTAISNRSTVTVAATDTLLIGDASDSANLKKIVASDFVRTASLGTNVATFLATPSSSNLAAALTDESNSGVVPFMSSGTFTPVLYDDTLSNSESQTYIEQSGVYRRFGDTVFFVLTLQVDSLGTLTTTQLARIGGLPFTVSAHAAAVSVGYASSINLPAVSTPVATAVNGTTHIALFKFSATTGTTDLTIAEFSSNARILLSGTYIVG